MDSVAMLEGIWGPMERGESYDIQPFFDSLDDDVVFTTSAGELHGKQAVVAYFAHSGELLDAQPFVKPLEYFGRGDRAVIVGEETFTVKKTGVTARAPWAWVHDIRNGLVTRIVAIQDLSAIGDTVAEALANARSAAAHRPEAGLDRAEDLRPA